MGIENILGSLMSVLDKGVLFSVNRDLCMIIRKAEEKDIPAVIELFQQVQRSHVKAMFDVFRGEDDPSRLATLGSQILGWIQKPTVLLSVAEEGDSLRGALCAYRVDIPDDHPVLKKRSFIKIDTLVVREDSYGMGIGRRLMEEVLQWAASQRLRDIEVSSYVFNQRAREFYDHLGFVEERVTMRLSL
ncbi:MAG: GNAT family N-acetyltransferase [Spirochaetales bacterium]|nr:GNAT family N-acetyltransferase [Spirochaetales bacterium]